MGAGEVIGLAAVLVFAVLVGAIAIPLVKLGKLIDGATSSLKSLSDEAVPLLSEVTSTVSSTNHQLVKVDTITDNVAQVSTNVSALTALFAATLGSPVVKVAAFSYGVRQAMSGRKARTARSGRK